MLIKYIKSVLWRVAKCLSYIEEARCLKVSTNKEQEDALLLIRVLETPVLTPRNVQRATGEHESGKEESKENSKKKKCNVKCSRYMAGCGPEGG